MHAYYQPYEQRSNNTAFKLIIVLGFLGLGGFLLVGDIISGGNPFESTQFQATEIVHNKRMKEYDQDLMKVYEGEFQIREVQQIDEQTGQVLTFRGTSRMLRTSMAFQQNRTDQEQRNKEQYTMAREKGEREVEEKNRELAEAVDAENKDQHNLTQASNAVAKGVMTTSDATKQACKAGSNNVTVAQTGAVSKLESLTRNTKKEIDKVVQKMITTQSEDNSGVKI